MSKHIDWLDRAERAIARVNPPDTVYDVCAEHGQILGNVRHTAWLREAVAAALCADADNERKHARNSCETT